jgi:putative transposase
MIVEDLKVSSMSKSAAGTVDEPGATLRQNQVLTGRYWIRAGTKCAASSNMQRWRGGEVQTVNPAYTSQKCSLWSYREENRQSQAVFVCVACGYEANADINGARNILAAGHAVLSGINPDAPVRRRKPLSEERAMR